MRNFKLIILLFFGPSHIIIMARRLIISKVNYILMLFWCLFPKEPQTEKHIKNQFIFRNPHWIWLLIGISISGLNIILVFPIETPPTDFPPTEHVTVNFGLISALATVTALYADLREPSCLLEMSVFVRRIVFLCVESIAFALL